MNATYFQAWLLAFAVTQLVEVPLVRWLARLGWLRAFSLSLVTHPAVWYVIPPLCYRAGLGYSQMIWIAEAFAWLVEAAMLVAYGVRWRSALLVSLVANGASVLVGVVARTWFGMP
jgi:hypothetical protein